METRRSTAMTSPLSESSAPSLGREDSDALKRCASAVRRRGLRAEIEHCDAPSDALRDALERHADRLRGALRPAGVGYSERVIAVLFSYFPDFSGGGDGALLQLRAYANPLAKFPEWALQRMCAQAENSRAPHRPSLPILKGWADDAVRPLQDEFDKIEFVLRATVIVPTSAIRRKPSMTKWRAMAAELEKVGEDRPARGELMAPSMTARLAGDRSVPLGEFLAATRQRSASSAPAPANTQHDHGR
jgi:hypothetical protein